MIFALNFRNVTMTFSYIFFFNETWRHDREEHFILPTMDRIFLSGGNTNEGVGIAISGRMMKQISNVSFHAYSPRLCLLQLIYSGLTFSVLSCYFPTSWDEDASIEGMYELLDSVLQGLGQTPCRILVGGDFNACIGGVQPGDDLHSLGWWGVGRRNDRGVHLANWVLQNGFHILSRQTSAHDINDSWTCQRYFDETQVQLDFISDDSKANVADVWLDNIVPIGLDHRCLHCIVTWTAQRRLKKMSAKGLKNWKPYLDENGEPTPYQSKLLHIEASNNGNVNEQLLKLEGDILMAGREGGECKRIQTRFLPSDDLKQLRLQRRVAENRGIKKELPFQIARLQRRELRKWKSSNLQMHLR